MVAMVNMTFEERRLKATFTFRIMETIKHTKIHPMPRTTAFPRGLPLATGIILALLSLNLPLMAVQGEGDAKEADMSDAEPGTIKGKVTDIAHPEPHNLEGAVVTVKNDKLLAAEGGEKTVKTDSSGEYQFGNLPPGEYIVTASKPGYEPHEFRRTVSPRATAFCDFILFLKGTEVGPPEYVGKERREKPKPRRPQEPKKPYPYKEEEVVYQSKKADVQIAGTFTFPDSNGPFPAVILLSDYGIHDRNELFRGLEHRPFLILADYLTRQGIAVLRTDDRGEGGSTGDLFASTFDDLADDALAGIEYLKSRNEVKASQIGLIGHGAGGLVALATATRSEDVAFIVLMAGIGLTGEELFLLRSTLIRESQGESDKEIAKNDELYRRVFDVLKQEKDDEAAMQKIRDVIADVTVKLSETKLSEEEIQAIRMSSGKEYGFTMLNPYFRSFLAFDPRPALMRLKCPVLAFNSEDNLEIPTKQNLNAIEEALKASGNEHYAIKVLPGLNWLFQTVQPGVTLSEIEETISPVVLELIGGWILQRTD